MNNLATPNTNSPILLTVVPCDISNIAISPAARTVLVGTTNQFKAVGTCSNGAQVDITNVVNWQTNAPSIAMPNATGLMAGWSPGAATVTASISNVMSLPASINVVDTTSLAAINISPQIAKIAKGNLQQFKAVGTYRDGSTQNITAAVNWNTDALDTVSINTSGLASGLAYGNAEVTATVNGLSSPAARVAVTSSIASIAITPASATMKVLGSQQFKATASHPDGTTKDISDSASWATSAPGIVNFSGNGLAYGVAKGTATITAVSGGVASPGIQVTVTSK